MRSTTSIGGSSHVSRKVSGGYQILHSIGQPGVIGVVSADKIRLRQGFLQPMNLSNTIGMASQLKVHAYPNPFSTDLTISVDEELEKVWINVYDLLGRTAFSTVQEKFTIQEIDLSFCSQGLYVLKVQSGNEIFSTLIQKN